jgi:hypothetical protein
MIDVSRLKLGRKAVKTDTRTLKLSNYLTEALAAPPPSLDYTKGITSYGMMLNDNLGDCTIAALGHAVQIWTANVGAEVTLPDSVILQGYEKFCGYNPVDPSTDQGGVILDVLTDFKAQGLGGQTVLGFVEGTPSNTRELKQGISLFGGVYIGLGLPLSAQAQVGGVWDVVPDDGTGNTVPGSWGGHCIFVPAYTGTNKVLTEVTAITWGALQKMTRAFWEMYVDEVAYLLSPAWFGKTGAPNGLNLAQLQSDLALIR